MIVQYNDYTVFIKIIVKCNIAIYFLTIFTFIMRFCYGIYLYYGKAYRKNENKNQCKYFLYANLCLFIFLPPQQIVIVIDFG